MHIIPLASLVVPEGRQRKTFIAESLETLAESIRTNGLIYPLVVTPNGEMNGAQTFELICGERRKRAIGTLKEPYVHAGETIQPGHAPTILLSELTSVRKAELELAENVDREQLPWQERIEAIARVHAIRIAHNPEHSALDTAREVRGEAVGSSAAQGIREAIRVSEFLSDPDVARAGSLREATKIVERKTVQAFERQLAAQLGPAMVPSTVHTLIHGDAFEIVPTLPSNSFDIILTDPPYGIEADTFKMQSSSESGTKHDYSDDLAFAIRCANLIARDGFRVAKPNAHLYMFCDLELFYSQWRFIFRTAGWDIWPNPIIWDKCGVGMLLGNANGPRHTYEAILFATKGARQVTSKGKPDIVSIRPSQAALHPAEKPAALYAELLSRSRIPGDSVLDPFAGSCPIFPACNVHTLRATAIEKEAHHYATGAKRVNETSIITNIAVSEVDL